MYMVVYDIVYDLLRPYTESVTVDLGGLTEWFEKTMVVIVLLYTSLEYGYYARRYEEKTD